MRIYKIITKEEVLSSFNSRFQNVSLKNMLFSLFGQFSFQLSFLNLPIISLLTQLLVKLAL